MLPIYTVVLIVRVDLISSGLYSRTLHCYIYVSGLPADVMTVDHVYIYWYHTPSQKMYVMDKATGNLKQTHIQHVTDIQAYGAHLHPLPGI